VKVNKLEIWNVHGKSYFSLPHVIKIYTNKEWFIVFFNGIS